VKTLMTVSLQSNELLFYKRLMQQKLP